MFPTPQLLGQRRSGLGGDTARAPGHGGFRTDQREPDCGGTRAEHAARAGGVQLAQDVDRPVRRALDEDVGQRVAVAVQRSRGAGGQPVDDRARLVRLRRATADGGQPERARRPAGQPGRGGHLQGVQHVIEILGEEVVDPGGRFLVDVDGAPVVVDQIDHDIALVPSDTGSGVPGRMDRDDGLGRVRRVGAEHLEPDGERPLTRQQQRGRRDPADHRLRPFGDEQHPARLRRGQPLERRHQGGQQVGAARLRPDEVAQVLGCERPGLPAGLDRRAMRVAGRRCGPEWSREELRGSHRLECGLRLLGHHTVGELVSLPAPVRLAAEVDAGGDRGEASLAHVGERRRVVGDRPALPHPGRGSLIEQAPLHQRHRAIARPVGAGLELEPRTARESLAGHAVGVDQCLHRARHGLPPGVHDIELAEQPGERVLHPVRAHAAGVHIA